MPYNEGTKQEQQNENNNRIYEHRGVFGSVCFWGFTMTKEEAEAATAQMFASGTGYALGRIDAVFQEKRAKEVNELFEKVLPDGK